MLFFSFFWFTKLSKVHGYHGSMLFLTKYESNLIVHSFCSPSHYNGERGQGERWLHMKICQNFVVTKFFLTFVVRKTSMGGVKNKWGSNIYYHITTLSLFHFFRNSQHQHTEKWMFFLRISLGNVNASLVTCQYPQIYNFNVRKEFLETLCKYIYPGF